MARRRDEVDRDVLPAIDWDRQPLGQMSDLALAEHLDVSRRFVTEERTRRGIALYRSPTCSKKIDWRVQPLG